MPPPQDPGQNVVDLLNDIKAQNEITNAELLAMKDLLWSILNALTGVTSA